MPAKPAPDPRRERSHRIMVGTTDQSTATVTAENYSFVSGEVLTFYLDVAGLRYTTVRGKTTTTNGTLAFAFVRPDGTTAYTTDNPANVTLTAGTENDSGEITCAGQSRLRVTFTAAAGAGVLDYLDTYGL